MFSKTTPHQVDALSNHYFNPQTSKHINNELNQYIKHVENVIKSNINKLSQFEKEELTLSGADENFLKKFNLKKPSHTFYGFSQYDPKIEKRVDDVAKKIKHLARVEQFKNKIDSIIIFPRSEIEDSVRLVLYGCYLSEDKKSQQLSNTLLSAIAPTNRDFVKNEFINELEFYRDFLFTEALSDMEQSNKTLANSYKTFAGKVLNLNAKVKTVAADKIIGLLSGERDIKLETQDVDALRDRRLGKIMKKYEAFGLLPKAFIDAENARFERVEKRMFCKQ